MNKKRVILCVASALLVAITAITLVACNYYKQDSIGGGSPNEASISNGSYYVRQGGYVYFINGYAGETTDNSWGKALKQGIVRAQVSADGKVNNKTVKVVVPLVVDNKNTNGGIAIFGNWIYYTIPNTEKEPSGDPSTTKTDFMRTALDGAITQRIGTINSRESEYMFTPTRVLYFLDGNIKFIDFSGMKTNASINDGKGTTSGTLASNVEKVLWQYDASYKKGQTEEVSDYIFYTEKLTGDYSFESYNNLYAVKYNGSGKKTLITKDTYLSETEKQDLKDNPENVDKYLDKIATVSLLGMYQEDNDTTTLYYTKTFKKGEETTTAYLYMSKFNRKTGALDVANEVQLTTLAATAVYPLGYDKGTLAVTGGGYKYYSNGMTDDEKANAPLIVSSDLALSHVTFGTDLDGKPVADGEYTTLYYAKSSSATELDYIVFNKDGVQMNARAVILESFKSDWLKLEFDAKVIDGQQKLFFFFVNTKYNYVQYIDVYAFDKDVEDAKSEIIGKMTDADKKQYEKDLEEAEKDKDKK